MLYVVLAPSFALLVYMWAKLRKSKRHNSTLVALRELRGDAVAIIKRRGDELSEKEYAQIRFVMKGVDSVEKFHLEGETRMFDLRAILSDPDFETATGFARKRDDLIPSDEQIGELHKRFGWQISFLVFHHTSKLFLAYLMCRFIRNISGWGIEKAASRSMQKIEDFAMPIHWQRKGDGPHPPLARA